MKAFLPGSQVDLRPIRNLDKLIGQTYEFKVIKFNKKRGNIVLSRRVLLEKERDELKAQDARRPSKRAWSSRGTIKNITEYGAFVDLGGIDGLLHITDMCWGRVNHPSEVFKVGDEVTVKVLKYNAETERVSLGLKQTQEDPWNHARGGATRSASASRGKVMSHHRLRRVRRAGAGRRRPHPRQRDELDQEGQAPVASSSRWARRSSARCSRSTRSAKRISLGLKQLEPDPWTLFTDKYNPGDKIGGKVRSHHRLRRVRRHRRGRRRHGPQDATCRWTANDQQPGRPLQQGRRRRGHHPLDQPRREEGLASASSSSATIRGFGCRRTTRSAPSSRCA